MKNSETRQFKVVFKDSVNDYNTLFGGIAMKWMDEVAYITATRYCRKNVVTTSTDNVKFLKPIPYGYIAEVIGKVKNIGNIKIEIEVEIFIESMYKQTREKAVKGSFCFVAVNEKNQPQRLNKKSLM
jgi:acyl-CoA hydrolase